MGRVDLSRRSFLEASAASAALGVGASTAGASQAAVATDSSASLGTRITFRALVDAVIPETPDLGDEPGEEYVAGGLNVGVAEFMITYTNNMFNFDLPLLSSGGNLQLATPFAKILDTAAVKLLLRGEDEFGLKYQRALDLFADGEASTLAIYLQAGTFSKLAPRDRLRAISLLDELELELSLPGDTLFEFDAGIVGQLVIGFTEAVYYSEWQGYDDFWNPPSEREHPNDPDAVQGWRQTGFPGFSDGHAALRGYMNKDGSQLGAGETWKRLDDDVAITLDSGSFPENDYDTSDYEEPFPVESSADGSVGDSATDDGTDSTQDGTDESDDGDDDDDDGWWF